MADVCTKMETFKLEYILLSFSMWRYIIFSISDRCWDLRRL